MDHSQSSSRNLLDSNNPRSTHINRNDPSLSTSNVYDDVNYSPPVEKEIIPDKVDLNTIQ